MIEISRLSRVFSSQDRTDRIVVDNVSLIIPQGQFVCVLGSSGCGKTTLLSLIAGFIAPTSGKIFFQGRQVSGPGPDRGVVFQDGALFPWLTAQGNVEFGLRQRGDHSASCRETAQKYLDLVGMLPQADAYPHTLSGGMRQRIAIARVLALDPAVLLMDEPFSALDQVTREHLQDELLRIWQAGKCTVFYVTHSVEEAAYLADRVIIMGPPPKNVFSDQEIPLKRPRTRRSNDMVAIRDVLYRKLALLPCCITPNNSPEERTR
jgi:NitT/TauT family transport system ATP-binding protein